MSPNETSADVRRASKTGPDAVSSTGPRTGPSTGPDTGPDTRSSIGSVSGPGTGTAPGTSEPLACVNCRNRKLRCCRTKPACARCTRLKTACVYPESRRKPAFKRRNVKELEARLAQVEVLLKESGASKPAEEKADGTADFDFSEPPVVDDVFLQGLDYADPMASPGRDPGFSMPQSSPFSMPTGASNRQHAANGSFNGELVDLGVAEPLPPFEVMEELNNIYFERQSHFMPIIHPTRYMRSFYSPPHMKPPMCLQYAIWALAANGHDKYASSHAVLYHRARQYAELDELKGSGEHFITVGHAQAWCCIALDESKSMHFTRASMSSARAVRLVQMMGLHRLDGPLGELSPTLLPPANWQESEERRRTFWGAFCIDSHCSISTGWPLLIDPTEITTLLPSSELAFVSGTEVGSCRLEEAFRGFSYSSFAGAVLICHTFNQILKHVHRPKANDNPEDLEYGQFWQRHREIDNTLTSAFMFLPEGFRMPQNYRDPTAVHTNLNLHASVICLHHAAIDKIDEHNHGELVKKASQGRLLTAAQEIVNIIKLTSSVNSRPKSPLAALSLYCAATVYVYQCKETQSPTNVDNLDFILSAMDAIGREHVITRAFLRQMVKDIERNDLCNIVKLPTLGSLPPGLGQGSHNIPLLVRSAVSRHSEMQPPLPGRLPLGKPEGVESGDKMKDVGIGFKHGISDSVNDMAAELPSELPPTDAASDRRQPNPFRPMPAPNGRLWTETSASDPYPPGTTNPNSNDSGAALVELRRGGGNAPQPTAFNPPRSTPFVSFQHGLPHRQSPPSARSVLNQSSATAAQRRSFNDVSHHSLHLATTTTAAQQAQQDEFMAPGSGGHVVSPDWDMSGAYATAAAYGQFGQHPGDAHQHQHQHQHQLGLDQVVETDPWSLMSQASDNMDWSAMAGAGPAAAVQGGNEVGDAGGSAHGRYV